MSLAGIGQKGYFGQFKRRHPNHSSLGFKVPLIFLITEIAFLVKTSFHPRCSKNFWLTLSLFTANSTNCSIVDLEIDHLWTYFDHSKKSMEAMERLGAICILRK
jgi:hypothetical protein